MSTSSVSRRSELVSIKYLLYHNMNNYKLNDCVWVSERDGVNGVRRKFTKSPWQTYKRVCLCYFGFLLFDFYFFYFFSLTHLHLLSLIFSIFGKSDLPHNDAHRFRGIRGCREVSPGAVPRVDLHCPSDTESAGEVLSRRALGLESIPARWNRLVPQAEKDAFALRRQ